MHLMNPIHRRLVRSIVPVAALFVVVAAAWAGGWAVITLNEFPEYAMAGKTLNLTFEVRQHGRNLLSGLDPSVRATTPGGLVAKAAARPTGNFGEYAAALTLPEAGQWTITVTSGFNANAITLPVLSVIRPDSPLPAAPAEAERGQRLFAAKGCVGCHLRAGVAPEPTAFPWIDLTGQQFPPDYLRKFLADPSVKPAEMPNLHLGQDEIAALIAFLNGAGEGL